MSDIASSQSEGVIVGTDRRQEWLLPWWWMHYAMHNTHPVTFIDYGDLSEDAVKWCKNRGNLLKLELVDDFIAKKEAVDPLKAKDWESMHADVWKMRFTWYKKPFALKLSPYQKTLWLDPDCQVRGSIKPLFSIPLGEGGFAAAPEHEISQNHNLLKGRLRKGEVTYNAGVLLFDDTSPIIKEWIKQSRERNHEQCSDQQMLVQVLHELKIPYISLNPIYNWTNDMGLNPHALIYHWWGAYGKTLIQQQIKDLSHKMGFRFNFDDPVCGNDQQTVTFNT